MSSARTLTAILAISIVVALILVWLVESAKPNPADAPLWAMGVIA